MAPASKNQTVKHTQRASTAAEQNHRDCTHHNTLMLQ